MTRSESKYFNTAVKMVEAFIELLNKKDFDYITVKEICALSGVNRSTFYLHYETINDLLLETSEFITQKFYSYFEHLDLSYEKIKSVEKEKLIFITPEFLTPWLTFIKQNKVIYTAVVKKFNSIQLNKSVIETVYKTINTVLDKFDVPSAQREYMIAFYLEGLNAIVKQWLKNDCKDEIDDVIKVIEECVRPK